MKLTSREILLLKVLFICTIITLSYYFVIDPQFNKIDNLQLNLEDSNAEVLRADTEINAKSILEKEMESIRSDAEGKIDSFYPIIDQKRIIVLMDGLLDDNKIDSDSIVFSQVETVEMEQDIQKQRMSVSLPYTADYDNLISFIKAIEAENRMIKINNIQIAASDGNKVSGNLSMDFYAVSKPTLNQRDKDYLDWPNDDEHGKSNPFEKKETKTPDDEMSQIP